MKIQGLILLTMLFVVSCAEPVGTSSVRITIAFATESAGQPKNPQLATPTPAAVPSDTAVPLPAVEATPEPIDTAISPTAEETSGPAVRVKVNAANVRSGPGMEHPAAGAALAGEVLAVLGASEDGNWYHVALPDGRTGWIGSSVVEVVSSARLVEVAAVETPTDAPVVQDSPPPAQIVEQATETVLPNTDTPVPPPTALPEPPSTEPPPPGNEQIAVVSRIVDGDTIHVNLNGQDLAVRYIGIDTPEYDQPCGSEATQANAGLVSGQTVRLVKDVSETDRYDRLLRYVYVGDLFVNAELVRQGWAVAKQYPPDTSQAGYLDSLQAGAPVHNCALPPTAVPPPPPQVTQPPQGNCDPSYPDVCIPSPPPDLDCGDIGFRRFRVVGSDPHRFDGNHDGIGCESG